MVKSQDALPEENRGWMIFELFDNKKSALGQVAFVGAFVLRFENGLC